MAQWFWRRFLNFVNVFWLFRNYLPLENDRALHLNKLESPSTKDALCQVWLKLVQGFFRWLKCEKFMATPMKQMMPTTTDNGQILIRKAHLRWAKNHCNAYCNTFLNIAIYHDKKTLHLIHKTSNMNMYYTLLRTKCF